MSLFLKKKNRIIVLRDGSSHIALHWLGYSYVGPLCPTSSPAHECPISQDCKVPQWSTMFPLLVLVVPVMTMSNSGSYPVTPVALQLYSSTLVAHHLLQSRSCRDTSIKYDPWSNPYTVLTTPRRLPCLDMSSPWTQYIPYLVAFSPDLTLFSPDLT